MLCELGSELMKSMRVFDLEDIEGIAFGFRSPSYSKTGLSVPGLHLHFVSSDRRFGGHVMEFSMGSGVISSSVVIKIQMEQPTSKQFNAASLGTGADVFEDG
ncbi:alpha-acetolactate decarboxylase [Fusarium acutatum]|uniref:Alpha-acetolactate decarboxylase n=1 Tax=Fusarium acutatum TaxID=78861 RepID=A0A8H4NJ83_9HYPO|nr:alpha-acetolactate decarboxylase [Fusarium acutatum]